MKFTDTSSRLSVKLLVALSSAFIGCGSISRFGIQNSPEPTPVTDDEHTHVGLSISSTAYISSRAAVSWLYSPCKVSQCPDGPTTHPSCATICPYADPTWRSVLEPHALRPHLAHFLTGLCANLYRRSRGPIAWRCRLSLLGPFYFYV